jgi:hypothetical protein
LRAVVEITEAYLAMQSAACSGLTAGMSSAEQSNFRTYIYDYTRVMAGCLQIDRPPARGVLAFGPGNTAAAGVMRAPLSSEDASVLVAAYLSAFASKLDLDAGDSSLVQAHLERTVQSEIDASLSAAPSVCAGRADAGQ